MWAMEDELDLDEFTDADLEEAYTDKLERRLRTQQHLIDALMDSRERFYPNN